MSSRTAGADWPPPKPPPVLPPPLKSPPPRWTRLTFAVAYRRDGPTSSTSSSTTVRFSPSRDSYERCLSRPWTTTRMPLVKDSATFSAYWRHTLQLT